MRVTSELIREKKVLANQRVSVWRDKTELPGMLRITYRKSWECHRTDEADAWLSWAHHEHLLLSMLAGRGAQYVAVVSDLHVEDQRVELVTLDAGPELQRDWLNRVRPALQTEYDFLKLIYYCLLALKEIHEIGIVHGDFKADNICIAQHGAQDKLDLRSLKIIDFAFSLSRDNHLRFVLPIDPERIDYLPNFYKDAIRKAQAIKQPSVIQLACCPEVDLYSLGVMVEKCILLVKPLECKYWTTLVELINHCKQVGARKPSKVQLWWRKDFAQPTIQAVYKAEKLLRSEPPPLQEFSSTITPLGTPIAPVSPPVSTPLTTPLALDRAIDHSLSPIVTSKDLVVSTNSKTRSSFITEKKQKRQWLWLVTTILLSFLFYRINYIYERDNLIVSDTGYYLGLAAIVLAPVLLWRVLQTIIKIKDGLDRLLFVLTGWLFVTSFYFLITIKGQRSSWLYLLFY